MRSLTKIALFVAICLTASVQGQDLEAVTKILEQVEARYFNSEHYTMDVLYEYYEPGTSSEAIESMEGLIVKDGSNYYTRIHNTETLFIDSDYLKINHDEKAVLYGLIDQNQRPAPIELSKLAEYFTAVSVSQDGDISRFELQFKESQLIPYSKMAIEVNQNTFEIVKQDLYLIEDRQMPGGQNPLAKTNKGIVSISFKEKPFSQAHANRFLLSDYITKGAQVSLSKKLATYSLYQ